LQNCHNVLPNGPYTIRPVLPKIDSDKQAQAAFPSDDSDIEGLTSGAVSTASSFRSARDGTHTPAPASERSVAATAAAAAAAVTAGTVAAAATQSAFVKGSPAPQGMAIPVTSMPGVSHQAKGTVNPALHSGVPETAPPNRSPVPEITPLPAMQVPAGRSPAVSPHPADPGASSGAGSASRAQQAKKEQNGQAADAYPELGLTGVAEDDVQGTEAELTQRCTRVLNALGDPSKADDIQFKVGSSYLVWVLRELTAKEPCKAVMLASDAPSILSGILSDDMVPVSAQMHAAGALMRLGSMDPEACAAILAAGAVEQLGLLLHAPTTAMREAAALALAHIGAADQASKLEVFNSVATSVARLSAKGGDMSQAARAAAAKRPGSGSGVGAVPLARLARPNPIEGLATMLFSGEMGSMCAVAALAEVLTSDLPPDYQRRISVDGQSLVSVMATLLQEGDDIGAYSATKALCNLAATVKPSIKDILEVLVATMGGRETSLLGRCRCAEVLWRLCRSVTRPADDALIVAQLQARGKALAAILVELLEHPELENPQGEAGAMSPLAVAGLAAMVSHETPSATHLGNQLAKTGPPMAEEIRLTLAGSPGTVACLIRMLSSSDGELATVAAACLSHLAASTSTFPSEDSAAGSKPGISPRQGKRAYIRSLVTSSTPSTATTPRAAIMEAKGALAAATALLESEIVTLKMAAVTLLNNLVYYEDTRKLVYSELSSNKDAFAVFKDRIKSYETDPRLEPCHTCAAFVHQSLDRVPLLRSMSKDKSNAPKGKLKFCAPLPPKLQQRMINIWGPSKP